MSGLCRECETFFPTPHIPEGGAAGHKSGQDAATPRARCPRCRSPRVIVHAELEQLSIGHVDCDAFYAAVEKRDRPDLRDRPVIIGGGHRGVVSTACYIARLSGVRSAMPMFTARKLCPDAVVLPPDMGKYRRVAGEIRQLMNALTPLVEPVSIDEAFLDLSGTAALHKMSPAQSLNHLTRQIETQIGVTVSVGLSHNKFLAKLASDLDKPRGFSLIGQAETASFLASRSVGMIWGVGKVMREQLAGDGITTMGQVQQMALEDLARRYGQMGSHIWHLARGLDRRRVEPDSATKSISAETTFDIDIADAEALSAELWPLCEKVAYRLKSAGLAGQVVHLKLKTAGFRLITRQTRLSAPSQLAETLYRAGQALLQKEATGDWYRLIGIGMDALQDAQDADPIDLGDPDALRRRKVEEAMDSVRAKLGQDAIIKGRSLKPTK
ncbi:DNA polymerase IV [Dongia rigui]|uniref:DNA polymerase IV n=1 Tax=Dongia rigui TaxID=940149 RepID=A0ABU5E543_9PROT|nr:DNA polymerase IV [Dongia rigui]MDY0874309.1 DNA polymerase IV [Dongia rigui]